MAIDEPGMEGKLPRDAVRWLRASQGAATEMTRSAGETEEGMRETRGRGPVEAGQTRHWEAASEAGVKERMASGSRGTSEAGHSLTLGLVEGLELRQLIV